MQQCNFDQTRQTAIPIKFKLELLKPGTTEKAIKLEEEIKVD